MADRRRRGESHADTWRREWVEKAQAVGLTITDPLAIQHALKCRHFNGLAGDAPLFDRPDDYVARCKAGVAYEDVRDDSVRPYAFPCFRDRPGSKGCRCVEYPTEEEALAHSRAAEERLREWSRKIDSDICPHHDQPITRMVQVGRCVYAEPCGCRLYQGTVPERWKAGQEQAYRAARLRLDGGY